jgi:hypothetical protein
VVIEPEARELSAEEEETQGSELTLPEGQVKTDSDTPLNTDSGKPTPIKSSPPTKSGKGTRRGNRRRRGKKI